MIDIQFIVKCKNISDAGEVITYTNENIGYVEMVNSIINHLEDESYDYEDEYKIGVYPYDEWDYEAFVDDEIKSGKSLFITIYKENGVLDWYWDIAKTIDTDAKIMTFNQFEKTYM